MLESLINAGNEIFGAFMLIIVGAVVAGGNQIKNRFLALMESKLDAEALERLEKALSNVIDAAEAEGKAITPIDAVSYLKAFNPSDLERFELSEDSLLDRAAVALAIKASNRPNARPAMVAAE